MSGLREQIKQLAEQRDAVEAEVNFISARLDATGVGMTGRLIDSEGFPRADLDIPAIRADRHRMAVLTNDHKALTNKIDTLLQELHGQTRGSTGQNGHAHLNGHAQFNGHTHSAASRTEAQPSTGPATRAVRPFAIVDEVATGSPASAAGFAVGDQLVALSDITCSTTSAIAAVVRVLQAHEGRSVKALILRRGAAMELELVPQSWQGQGLFGGKLRPL